MEQPPFFVQELPEAEQPYARLMNLGVHPLTNSELLALLLGDDADDPEALVLAQRILMKFRSLRAVARCDIREVAAVEGVNVAKASRVAAASEFARRVSREVITAVKVDSPEIVCRLIAQDLRALTRESLRALLLDTKYQLLRIEEVSLGSLNESIAHPREIFRSALTYSAYAMIIVHNHPSGDITPSKADRLLTKRLVEVGALLGIAVLDHIIVGGNLLSGEPSYYSFKEAGAI